MITVTVGMVQYGTYVVKKRFTVEMFRYMYWYWSLVELELALQIVEGDGVDAEADAPEDEAGQLLPGQLLHLLLLLVPAVLQQQKGNVLRQLGQLGLCGHKASQPGCWPWEN